MADISVNIRTPTIQAQAYRATIIPEGYYKIEGTKEITKNGTHNVGDYEFADVTVPERKEEQEATVDITKNGTTEILPDGDKVFSKATVNVNVPIPDGYIKPEGSMPITENGTFDVTEKAEVNVQVVAKPEKPYIDSSKLKYGSYMFAEKDPNGNTLHADLSLLEHIDTSNMVIMEYMFRNRTDLTYEMLNGLDTRSAINMQNMFGGATAITTIPITDTKKCKNFYSCFNNCTNLKTIDGIITIIAGCHVNLMFYQCRALEEVRFDEIIVDNNNLSFAQSSKLTIESLLSILNALSDNTGLDTTYTVTLGATNLAKLTAEQIAIATAKNINLA